MKAAALAACAVVLSLATYARDGSAGTGARDDTVVCPDVIVHTPVLLVDLVADTLSMPHHWQLTVFDDGLVRLGTAVEATGRSEMRVRDVGSARVDELVYELIARGAHLLCDHPDGSDWMPLQTVALLRGAPDGRPHTFSFRGALDEYAEVTDAIGDFVAETFAE